jgi:hypothetical protein
MAAQNGRTSTKRRQGRGGSTGGRSGGGGAKTNSAALSRQAAEVLKKEQQAGNSLGEEEPPFHRPKWHRAFSFGLITGALFLFSWVGQFIFQLIEVRNDAAEHGQAFAWAEFWPGFLASTFENWQSEFLQLVWQAGGLALFYFWGSSQSKEGDERIEAKLDLLLRDRGIDATKL